MLRDGPVPHAVHGALEYIAGVAFIVVALVLYPPGAGAAIATSIVVGVVILIVAATSDGPTSLVDQIPVPVHVVLDYVLAAFLIAAPFLFSFNDQTAPLVFFLALGIVHLLLTIATRFLPAGAGRGRSKGAPEPGRPEGGASPPVGE